MSELIQGAQGVDSRPGRPAAGFPGRVKRGPHHPLAVRRHPPAGDESASRARPPQRPTARSGRPPSPVQNSRDAPRRRATQQPRPQSAGATSTTVARADTDRGGERAVSAARRKPGPRERSRPARPPQQSRDRIPIAAQNEQSAQHAANPGHANGRGPRDRSQSRDARLSTSVQQTRRRSAPSSPAATPISPRDPHNGRAPAYRSRRGASGRRSAERAVGEAR